MNGSFFFLMLFFVVGQRWYELRLAQKHERILKKLGALEIAPDTYKYIVLFHVTYFLMLIGEGVQNHFSRPDWWLFLTVTFCILQGFRVWVIQSLGVFWNTKILILPGADVVKRGPCRWIRHPNYFIVVVELITLALLFQAYWTALFSCIGNAILLNQRIRFEEEALSSHTNYGEKFGLKDEAR